MLAFCTGFFDYHSICSRPVLLFLWVVTMGMLVVVFVAGSGANGATRWLSVGPLRIQPSEFAKVTVLYTAAMLASEFFGGRAMSYGSFAITVGVALGGPLALILVQPDKGTTGIIVLMIVSLAYASGFRRDLIVKVLGALCAIAMVIVLSDDYSRQRVLTMLDPWLDQWDSGYQLTQGFMAFGSGGLFGRGLGMSVAKYSYLPEAHNDFIFAVIGEELGLVGTLSVVALFVLLAYEAKKIADSARPHGPPHRHRSDDPVPHAVLPERLWRARLLPALRQAPAVPELWRILDHELPGAGGSHRGRFEAFEPSRDGARPSS